MKKNHLVAIKEIEKQIKETVNQMDESNSIEKNKLYYSKIKLLNIKYIAILDDLTKEIILLNKESKNTIIRTFVLVTINLIVLVICPPSLMLLILTNIINLYNIICNMDIKRDAKQYDAAYKYIINRSLTDMTVKADDIMKKYDDKILEQSTPTLDDFDKANEIITSYLYLTKYTFPKLTPNLKDIIIKILQEDLNSNEQNMEVLLKQAKDKVNKSSHIAILKIKNK